MNTTKHNQKQQKTSKTSHKFNKSQVQTGKSNIKSQVKKFKSHNKMENSQIKSHQLV